MKTLIIPDIHLKIDIAQEIIDNNQDVDKIICSGDFFDDFEDTLKEARATAIWLKNKLAQDNFTALWGNHDIPYAFSWNKNVICSGYSDKKSRVINKILNNDDWDKFLPYVWEQNTLISHAGLTLGFLKSLSPNSKDYSKDKIDKLLTTSYKIDKENLSQGLKPILFSAGWDRNGSDEYGGINWGCWSSFHCVKGISQIFGHTILKTLV